MADPVTEQAPAAAAVEAAPAVAPVVEAPAVAEAPPPADAPPAAVADAPPAVADAPVVAADAPPAPPTDLLKSAQADGEKPPVDAPPVDAKPPEAPVEPPVDAKPPEGDQPPVDAPPPAPQRLEPLAEYKYETPEDIKITDELRQTFHTAIEDARNGNPQALMDLHHQTMRDFAASVEQNQRTVWTQQLQDWQGQVEKDPQIGGDKFAAVSMRVAQMRDNYVSTHERGSDGWKADMASFNEFLDRTGSGNHPALWRFLDNVARVLAEPGMPSITDPKPAPQQRARGDFYDNPRSPRPNGAQ